VASTEFLSERRPQSRLPILMRPRRSCTDVPRLLPSMVRMVPPSRGPLLGRMAKISGPGHSVKLELHL
jgi:hypothetical protein